jgi:transposase InsO family protein
MQKDFMEQCTDKGIQHNLTTPYTPQQNGMVERHNQTMLDMARSMMKSMGMPNWMWGEAMLTAVFVLNQLPTRSVDGKTSYEAWYGT